MKNLLNTTLDHNRGAWPSWIKSDHDGKGAPTGFILRLADYIRDEFRQHSLRHDPISIIDASRRKSVSEEAQAEIWERVEDEACHVVFGSNLIEGAGASLDYTVHLCQQTFRGAQIDAVVGHGGSGHADFLDDSEQHGQQTSQSAIRTRREVIQHAQALSWAIERTLAGMPWTEEAVKTIHGILYSGMADHDVVPGQYRGLDHPIAAKYIDPKTGREKVTKFVHPRAVPSYMAAWVENLNRDIERAESGAPFDPYDLPAKHYHHFINIHPFGDGNGRTSRIILNCLVVKFTGHLIPMGEDDEEKDEFLSIAVRGAKRYHEEDGEVHLDEQEGHREIARFMARKSVKSLNRMWAWAEKH
ncbi:fido domain-containing protein [Nemania sp. NC0429]|nr:fido domain-containing protein [Nemania sp. NC0429]